jgi:hypothetical protein
MRTHDLRSACFLTLLLSHAGSAVAEGSSVCSVHSDAAVPTVIELYTSEGCSSCPPADRWFSQLKSDTGVIGLAFHVDYWDGLGWQDPFASSTFTARQAQLQKRNNARFSYTPQIVLNGADYPRWRERRLPLSARTASASAVQMTIARRGDSYAANVIALEGAPERLEAFWAMRRFHDVGRSGRESRSDAHARFRRPRVFADCSVVVGVLASAHLRFLTADARESSAPPARQSGRRRLKDWPAGSGVENRLLN